MNALLDPSAFAPAPSERLRVLVVEDDPVVRRLLRICLRQAGLDVIAASSGEEAIKIGEKTQETIHLVVTDGVMPGIDGFEVARHFATREPRVRVVLISGYLNHFVSRKDIPENVEAFFAKPFVSSEVVAKILELLGVPA
jgi:CheY-like chemotaxis protein